MAITIHEQKSPVLPCHSCPKAQYAAEGGGTYLLTFKDCPYAGNDHALTAVWRKGWCAFNPAKIEKEEERKSQGWKKGRAKL